MTHPWPLWYTPGTEKDEQHLSLSLTPEQLVSVEAAGPELCGVMDCHLRLKMLTMFVLLSATLICHTDAEPHLRCLNNYLFTINCSLVLGSENTSEVYWLSINDYDQETRCRLKEVEGGYFCSINITSLMPDHNEMRQFTDYIFYNMSLCDSSVSDACRLLISEYEPNFNIKPNAPCCLGLSLNASNYRFTWKHEDYRHRNLLSKSLQYQLQYYPQDQSSNISSHTLQTQSLSCSVTDDNLVAGTEYRARVRSIPRGDYWGEWSDWSAEIHWKTEPAVTDVSSAPRLSGLGKELFILCALVFLLLLSFACVKMWRRRAYIPTPAPYFHTLYNDYHGDFKSWVVTGDKVADALKAEKVLQVETVTKCVEVQEEGPRPPTPPQQPPPQEATYCNIPHPGCDSALLGVPYAVSTAAPAAADSGGWGCGRQALERGAPLYSNEYCTLSAFQQPHRRGAAAEYEN